MRTFSAVAVALTAVAAVSAAPTYKRNYDGQSFDFIVVGGGTAGLTVAGRLAESNASVLVLEAGGKPSDQDLPWQNPAQTGQLEGSPVDWNFTIQPVKGLNWRSIGQNRGFGLGGCSSINGMTAGRGSKAILDEWAALGNEGWGWDDLQEYYRKTWKLIPPPNDDFGRTYDPSLYSDPGGPGRLGYNNYNVESINGFIEACSAINISKVVDLNNGHNQGVKHELGTFDATTQSRSSSFTMFYDTSYARPNFRAVTFAFVEKILFSTPTNSSENPRATGVRYFKYDDNGVKQSYTVYASKEVINSAGTLQAPQLLMVSGIGARKELEEFGIDVVVDNEWVGKNLQETASTSLIYHAHPNASTSALADPTKDAYRAAAAYEYEQNRTGPLTAWDGITGPAFSFQRFSDEDLVKYGATDFLNNSDTSHIEQILWTSPYPNTSFPLLDSPRILDPKSSYLTISVYLSRPMSRGRTGLSSASMATPPAIYLNLYDHPADMKIRVEGVKRARKVAAHPAFQQYVYGPNDGEFIPGIENASTDEEIEDYIRASAVSTAHQCGTVAMRPREDQGVVDSRLRVYGVDGLRVVDNSIPPVMLDQHPTLTIYAIAEKAAVMILQDHNLA